MKKIIALLLAAIMILSLVACTAKTEAPAADAPKAEEKKEETPKAEESEKEEAPKEEAPADSGILTEEEAAEARDAGTLEGNPAAGYDYNEGSGLWYYSNYPNYKDFNADGKVKVAFVCKFSGPWFTPKATSLGETVEAAGAEYLFIDANSDEQAWIDGVQNIINQDFDAVVLTPVNTALLPDAVAMLQDAGIAYMTTDDPGADVNGFYAPHYGLDDYYLYNELGKAAVEAIEKKDFLADVADDYSNFLFVIMDSPAVEAIHKRSVGYYDAIKAAYPDIPEDKILWLDCGAGLSDDIMDKLSPTIQKYIATTDKWLLVSGTGSAVQPSITLMTEAGVDMNNVILSETCATDDVFAACRADETNSLVLLGLVSAPSGVGMGNILIDLIQNGTPIPAFTPYDFILVNHENIEDFIATYF